MKETGNLAGNVRNSAAGVADAAGADSAVGVAGVAGAAGAGNLANSNLANGANSNLAGAAAEIFAQNVATKIAAQNVAAQPNAQFSAPNSAQSPSSNSAQPHAQPSAPSKLQIKMRIVNWWEPDTPERFYENYFVRLLSREYDIIYADEPDFVLFSGSGGVRARTNFLDYDCVRIFYTGENLRTDWNVADYGIDFDFMDYGERHLRVPIFALYGGVRENRPLTPREKFCAYVVSNHGTRGSGGLLRDAFFERLCAYKRVDSGGRHKNNIGGVVADKHAWLQGYKFNLCFENSSFPGYLTEKLFDAYNAGCVPIYWGDTSLRVGCVGESRGGDFCENLAQNAPNSNLTNAGRADCGVDLGAAGANSNLTASGGKNASENYCKSGANSNLDKNIGADFGTNGATNQAQNFAQMFAKNSAQNPAKNTAQNFAQNQDQNQIQNPAQNRAVFTPADHADPAAIDTRLPAINPRLLDYKINPKAFINAHDFATLDALLDEVKRLDNDPAAFEAMRREPLFLDGFDAREFYEARILAFFRRIFSQGAVGALRRGTGQHLASYAKRQQASLAMSAGARGVANFITAVQKRLAALTKR